MTTKVIVSTSSWPAKVVAGGNETVVPPNANQDFYAHSGVDISITELAKPQEWPQWVDGVLYNTEAEFNTATAPPPVDDKKAAKAAQKVADDQAAADAKATADAAANDPATSSGKGKASATDTPVSGFVEDTKGKS